MPQAVARSISQYNFVLGNQKFAPVELFTGRRICTQEPAEYDLNDLVREIESSRTAKREAADAANAAKKMKKDRLVQKPAGEEVNGENEQNLEPGNVVRLNKKWDKADLDRMWKVVSINWEARTFEAVKFNIGNNVKPKVYDLDTIDTVISQTVRRIQESLYNNPAARMWYIQSDDLSVWEDSDWNPQGQRTHRIELLDDSAISLGPKLTLPPTPAPEMDPNPDLRTSTPAKKQVLSSYYNAWKLRVFIEKFAGWTASPEIDLNSSSENTLTSMKNEESDASFHSAASSANSSALNESDLAKLELPEPRRSNRQRKPIQRYEAK